MRKKKTPWISVLRSSSHSNATHSIGELKNEKFHFFSTQLVCNINCGLWKKWGKKFTNRGLQWRAYCNFTSIFTSTLIMSSFYSTPQKTAEHLFTSLIFHNTQHMSLLHLQKKIWKRHFCWNILYFCIGIIVDISPSYIFTLSKIGLTVITVKLFL